MTTVKLKIVRLPHAADIPLPAYQSAGAAGLDLHAAVPADRPIAIEPGKWASIPAGISLELPPETEGQIRPRSGLASRHAVTVLNAPGTIDQDYRGEVHVLLINLGTERFEVTRGMRIAQLVIAPMVRVQLVERESLGRTTRGAGGFGSTGRGDD